MDAPATVRRGIFKLFYLELPQRPLAFDKQNPSYHPPIIMSLRLATLRNHLRLLWERILFLGRKTTTWFKSGDVASFYIEGKEISLIGISDLESLLALLRKDFFQGRDHDDVEGWEVYALLFKSSGPGSSLKAVDTLLLALADNTVYPAVANSIFQGIMPGDEKKAFDRINANGMGDRVTALSHKLSPQNQAKVTLWVASGDSHLPPLSPSGGQRPGFF